MMHHHRRITPAIALTLALAVSAPAAAWGDPQPLAQAETAIANHTSAGSGLCGDVCSGHGYGSVDAKTSGLSVRPHPAASGDAFDWGDAGIGAGAALVVVGIGLAGTRAATHSRKRHPRERRATASS